MRRDAGVGPHPARAGVDYSLRMPRRDPRLVPLAVLTVLLGLAAVMLLRVPVHRYVVACERTTGDIVCSLEQTRTAGTQRWRVPLGHDTATAAVVRVLAQRRGPARVLLYLEAQGRPPVFAAQFEGADAAIDAEAAAARLNQVLRRPSAAATDAAPTTTAARIEAVAPAHLRWGAWAGLGVMGLLILASYRRVQAQRADAAAA